MFWFFSSENKILKIKKWNKNECTLPVTVFPPNFYFYSSLKCTENNFIQYGTTSCFSISKIEFEKSKEL